MTRGHLWRSTLRVVLELGKVANYQLINPRIFQVNLVRVVATRNNHFLYGAAVSDGLVREK